MATYITEECINCGACEPECPNEAISEGDETYIIDPNLCTECVGFHEYEACQSVCPVECCLPDPDADESEQVLLDRAIRIHKGTKEGEKLAGLTALFESKDPNRPSLYADESKVAERKEKRQEDRIPGS